MANCKPYVVGIDCGQTTTMGIVDTRGKIVATISIKMSDYIEFEDYISAMAKSLRRIMGSVGGPQMIRGIGIGAPNANFYSGNIEYRQIFHGRAYCLWESCFMSILAFRWQ